MTSAVQQGTSVQEQVEETTSQDSNSDIVARTPPPKNSVIGSSAPSTPAGNHLTPATLNTSVHNASTPSPILAGSSAVRGGVVESAGASVSSSPTSIPTSSSAKEEDIANFPGRKSSPAIGETGLIRGLGRGGLSNQSSASNGAMGAVPSASEVAKRNLLGADERLGSSGMVQPLVSPLSNRMMMPQAAKGNDGNGASDTGNAGEAAAVMAGRVFSPSVVPGIQWRPGSSFQNPNEVVCVFAVPF